MIPEDVTRYFKHDANFWVAQPTYFVNPTYDALPQPTPLRYATPKALWSVISNLSETHKAVKSNMVSSLAIRVNMQINATELPAQKPQDDSSAYQLSGYEFTENTNTFEVASKANPPQTTITDMTISLAGRQSALVPDTSFYSGYDERYYYPMYRSKPWVRKGRVLQAELPSSAQKVTRVRLMGYTLMNKRQPSMNVHHEISSDDYLILKIKEFHGRVISNNQFANGAFAILQAGTTLANRTGVVEVEQYYPEGYADVIVNQPVVCRQLTLQVLDRMGEHASFGRLHVWLKLTVEPN
jgi:hypothetical protein